jgi:hypothetical protein
MGLVEALLGRPHERTQVSELRYRVQQHLQYLDYYTATLDELGIGGNVWDLDANGLTMTATGQSCTSGWVDQLHPHVSRGWREIVVGLSAYADQTVGLYITYASDWVTQRLGVFVNDVMLNRERGAKQDGDDDDD